MSIEAADDGQSATSEAPTVRCEECGEPWDADLGGRVYFTYGRRPEPGHYCASCATREFGET